MRRILQVVTAGATFLLTLVGVLLTSGLLDWGAGQIPRVATPILLLVMLGVPALSAVGVARWLGRRWNLSFVVPDTELGNRLKRVLIWAYLATAVFGVPATLSHQNAWAVGEYKRLHADGGTWASHPYIQSYLAIPVLPGVIVSYHEYQLAGLYGFGGFEVTVWYGAGVKSLWVLPLWLS